MTWEADLVIGRDAKAVVDELYQRLDVGDNAALDELVSENMANHAAGPQGRDGLRAILAAIDNDLGPVTVEQHHLIGEGDLVAQHLTLHGTHCASRMPLLAGIPVTGRQWRGRSSTSGASSTDRSSNTGHAATT